MSNIINIQNLLAMYKQKNENPDNVDNSPRFLCHIIHDYFYVPYNVNTEDKVRAFFSAYFKPLEDHKRYSVIPLWFSKRTQVDKTSWYHPVSLKGGGVLNMDGIAEGIQFRIKLMEYIVENDPNAALTFYY